jgi:Protein kinase domain
MTSLLGAMVGRHRLEEIVTSDALGVVHRAHDPATGRPLLIRLLLPLADDTDAARRFRIELAAIARLDHPGIVPVEEWGESDGVPYVVTADPGAQRLSGVLGSGRRLDARLALMVLRTLAAALDDAHRAGVVHGAVEPSRVLLGRDGSVRLTDFGITLLAGATPERDVMALAAIARGLLAGPPSRPAVDSALARRWETCAAMIGALEAALLGRRVERIPWRLPWAAGHAVPDRLPLWMALAAGAAALLLMLVVLAVHALRPAPTLALSPTQARAGDTVVATGAHLPAGQPGTLQMQGRAAPLGQFRADERGGFSVRFVVPPDLAGGRSVEACWGGACPLRQTLVVTAEPSPTATAAPVPVQTPAPTPTATAGRFTPAISLSRQSVRRQETIQVSGRGFDPAAQYVIFFEQGGHRTRVQAPASPDGGGSFTNPVRIPGDAHRGLAVVTACISPVAGGPLGACAQQAVMVTG